MEQNLLSCLIVAAATVVLAGACALVAISARRGRRVDDHPTCRRCRFDLTGLPALTRCPECGAPLAGRRDIVIGTRAPRPWLVVVATMTAAFALVAGTSATIHLGRRVDWQAAKPTWWLLREARSPNVATMTAALDTLTARGRFMQQFGTTMENARYVRVYTPAQEAELLDRLLEIQANRSLPWTRKWGEVFVYRMAEDALTAEQRDRFFRNMHGPTVLSVRPHIRLGDPLPVSISLDYTRAASVYIHSSEIATADVRMEVDGRPLTEPAAWRDREHVGLYAGRGDTRMYRREYEAEQLASLAPGVHALTYRARVRLYNWRDPAAPPLYTLPIEATATFTLRPPDQPTVTLVPDESMRAALLECYRDSDIYLLDDRDPIVSLSTVKNLPMPVSFRVEVRQDGRTWPVGRFAERSSFLTRLQAPLPGITPGRADLILTADAAAAAETIDVDRAWQGELVLADVPVHPPEPRRATRPTTEPTSRPLDRSEATR